MGCQGYSRNISIHVPRVEDDPTSEVQERLNTQFQSTSPVWRTTLRPSAAQRPPAISIHVPRVEDDIDERQLVDELHNFNPRPPCGGRLYGVEWWFCDKSFQSTSPVWRTTRSLPMRRSCHFISIHVPRVEDDRYA